LPIAAKRLPDKDITGNQDVGINPTAKDAVAGGVVIGLTLRCPGSTGGLRAFQRRTVRGPQAQATTNKLVVGRPGVEVIESSKNFDRSI